jgi:hypothetical protein
MEYKTFSEKEEVEVWREYIKLHDAGKKAEAHTLLTTLPLPPFLAKILKEKVGVDYLIQGGYNLSEAEKAFGQGWLNR